MYQLKFRFQSNTDRRITIKLIVKKFNNSRVWCKHLSSNNAFQSPSVFRTRLKIMEKEFETLLTEDEIEKQLGKD